MWHLLVPFFPFWTVRSGRFGLMRVRHLYVHTGVAFAEFAIIVPAAIQSRDDAPAWAWIVLGSSTVWSIGGIVWARRHDVADPGKPLADRLRASFLIELGLASAPALWAIGIAFVVNAPELVFAGLAASIVLMWWAAPRSARIDGIDERLRAHGIETSVREALADG
jgi:hypothetical protein